MIEGRTVNCDAFDAWIGGGGGGIMDGTVSKLVLLPEKDELLEERDPKLGGRSALALLIFAAAGVCTLNGEFPKISLSNG